MPRNEWKNLREMDQRSECVLCKHEDLNLISRSHIKTRARRNRFAIPALGR